MQQKTMDLLLTPQGRPHYPRNNVANLGSFAKVSVLRKNYNSLAFRCINGDFYVALGSSIGLTLWFGLVMVC